ncbi:MAG: AbrB family transcriptional regulator [Pseudomonadota bacterium]
MPEKIVFLRLSVGVLIGLLGGALFAALGLPLPWLLGAMAATSLAALGGVDFAVPNRLRQVTLAVAGSLIGTSFNPEVLARMGDWPVTAVLLVGFVVLSVVLSTVYFRLAARFDPPTAFMSSVPGGLSIMVALSDLVGGDGRQVALVQSIRVLVVVFLIPLFVAVFASPILGAGQSEGRLALEIDAAMPAMAAPTMANAWFVDGFEIALMAGLGFILARIIRLPAAYLTGPILASAVAHGVGWSNAGVPGPLLFVSFVIIGTSIGARFRGARIADLRDTGRAALGQLALLLALSVLAAAAISRGFDLPFLAVLLAFAPGGVFEMCLIAIAFNIDPAFVAFHHLLRLGLVMVVVPLLVPRSPLAPPR